jgi:serine/threonine protein kinase
MELLAGETLEARIKRVKSWKTNEILRIGYELASGLAAMHAAGLIHRDIKPTNVWLESRDGSGSKSKQATPPRVKILDFGLVRDIKEEAGITESGVVLGTPAFMSPEQVRGKKVDERTDLYSFGCILYRLCAGRYPHDTDNSMAALAAVVADEPEPLSTICPEIPPALARLVMQLLNKNPDDRPKSAALVAERLRQIQQNLLIPDSGSTSQMASSQIHEFETSELRLKPSFWSRHGIKILLAAGAGVVLLGFCVLASGVALFMLPLRPGEKKAPPPPPPPKEGKLFLSELKPVQTVSWPFFKKDKKDKKDKGKKEMKDFEFEPLVVDGKVSPHGIFMHAAMPFDPPASLTYQLDKKFSEFTARVSISDSSFGSKSALIFAVYGDGKELFRSRPILTRLDAQDISISVKDVTLLKLEVTTQAPDVGGAHGAWVEPLLKR